MRACSVKMGDLLASLPEGFEESDYVKLYNNIITFRKEILAPLFLVHTSTDIIKKGGYRMLKQVWKKMC
jgi:hypothetical protein